MASGERRVAEYVREFEVGRIKRSADPAPNNDSTPSKNLCRISGHPRLQTTDYGLQTTDYGLRTTDYGLRTTDYGLQTTDYRRSGTEQRFEAQQEPLPDRRRCAPGCRPSRQNASVSRYGIFERPRAVSGRELRDGTARIGEPARSASGGGVGDLRKFVKPQSMTEILILTLSN